MTWLLIVLAAWVVVAVLGALALGQVVHLAERRRGSDWAALRLDDDQCAPDARPPHGPFVPSPRSATGSEVHVPRGWRAHRRSGAA